jgi:hypothetical protein
MTKKWIIGKRITECYRCGGIRTYVIDETKMKVFTTCTGCEGTNEYELRDYKEKKPCEKCAHVREVKISMAFGQPSWSKLCTMCEYLSNAIHHENMAHHFRVKAAEVLAKRKKSAR